MSARSFAICSGVMSNPNFPSFVISSNSIAPFSAGRSAGPVASPASQGHKPAIFTAAEGHVQVPDESVPSAAKSTKS